MLKCHEFCQAAPDSEARPFWRDRPTHSELEVDCVMGCASETPDSSVLSASASPHDASSSPQPPRIAMNDELVAARSLCAKSRAAVVEMFRHARMGRALELESIGALVDDISSSISRHPDAFISLARLKSLDDYTYMHSVAVCALMIALGNQLGLPEALIRRVGLAGLLHDIGKMAIPGAVLNKPGRLTDEELQLVRTHPLEGEKTLSATSQVCEMVVDVCLHHHERFDGQGYPHQLAGEQISLFSRMAAVCDVYDAITSDRAYNEGWDPAVAVQKMSSWEGHFDDEVFRAFLKCVGIYPVGSLVQLKSGRIGVVVEQNSHSLLTPKVKLFYVPVLNVHITPKLVDLSDPLQKDRICTRVPVQRYRFKDTDLLWQEESKPQQS
ncbi:MULTISPECIES: HD-GYP domain-containing protein [Pseudomonas]|uniref:HD-GYP domain-containing protein n=2 Tax=Pseudomonas TaxID=286 RepID=A0A7Y7WLA0_9PSED|nr:MULTISPECIES: HD-GYP domain-containing protein [Pseudomonas]NWB83361.1 HD-GYP domain-containing protein [Pseudomonas gingeri]RBH52658.1 HD-GYP domain-containing protein [Pseudomonas sp. MWU13-2860]